MHGGGKRRGMWFTRVTPPDVTNNAPLGTGLS